MTPRFTLRHRDGLTFVHAFSTLHAALVAFEEMGDRYPALLCVETPTRGPRIVRGFTPAGIPLVERGDELLPLY